MHGTTSVLIVFLSFLDPGNPDPQGGLSSGAVVGIVIAAIVVIVAVVVIIFAFVYKPRVSMISYNCDWKFRCELKTAHVFQPCKIRGSFHQINLNFIVDLWNAYTPVQWNITMYATSRCHWHWCQTNWTFNAPFSPHYFIWIEIVTAFKCIFEETMPKLSVNFETHPYFTRLSQKP